MISPLNRLILTHSVAPCSFLLWLRLRFQGVCGHNAPPRIITSLSQDDHNHHRPLEDVRKFPEEGVSRTREADAPRVRGPFEDRRRGTDGDNRLVEDRAPRLPAGVPASFSGELFDCTIILGREQLPLPYLPLE